MQDKILEVINVIDFRVDDIKGMRRPHILRMQALFYNMKKYCPSLTLKEVAIYGNRQNHSIVLSSIAMWEERIFTVPDIKRIQQLIENGIKGRS